MRIPLLLGLAVLLSITLSLPGFGGPLEMATDCSKARKVLADAAKKSDPQTLAKVKQLLGVDELISCPVPGGRAFCFQCLDKNEKLRSLELFQDFATKRFEFRGFGCRCDDLKK
jgi:hypothetical protein